MFAYIKAFIAGVVSTLVFHQGLLWILDSLGYISVTAWSFQAVAPFGIARVISLAFWGGVWGVVLWRLIHRTEAAGYYVSAALLGALLPTLVGLLIVPLIRGDGFGGIVDGITLGRVIVGLILNAVFGLGVALCMRFMQPPR